MEETDSVPIEQPDASPPPAAPTDLAEDEAPVQFNSARAAVRPAAARSGASAAAIWPASRSAIPILGNPRAVLGLASEEELRDGCGNCGAGHMGGVDATVSAGASLREATLLPHEWASWEKLNPNHLTSGTSETRASLRSSAVPERLHQSYVYALDPSVGQLTCEVLPHRPLRSTCTIKYEFKYKYKCNSQQFRRARN